MVYPKDRISVLSSWRTPLKDIFCYDRLLWISALTGCSNQGLLVVAPTYPSWPYISQDQLSGMTMKIKHFAEFAKSFLIVQTSDEEWFAHHSSSDVWTIQHFSCADVFTIPHHLCAIHLFCYVYQDSSNLLKNLLMRRNASRYTKIISALTSSKGTSGTVSEDVGPPLLGRSPRL